jgi:hypothetical protein
MASLGLIRWGGLAAMLDGILWIADDLGGRLSPDPDDWDCNSSYDLVTNAIDSAAFLVLLVALVGLHARQRERYGPLGTAGFFAAFAGAAMVGVANPAEHCLGLAILGIFVYLPGVLLLSIGVLLLGIATVMAGVLPRWCGVALIVGMLAMFLGAEDGGMIVFGLAWLLLGYVLWSQRGVSVEQPPRVR